MSALWDKTPATYTSFEPLQSDVQSSGSIISRFLRRKDDSGQSSADSSRASSREVSVERSSSASREKSVSRELSLDREDSKSKQQLEKRGSIPKIKSSSDIAKSQQWGGDKNGKYEESSSQEDQTTKRTLSSVITRLSAILERRTATPQVYRDSDFKQFWMPDSSCKECYECGDKFTTFRRRHHCRICGQIFCYACCSQELPGKTIGYKGSIRVCIYCHSIVNQYAQQAGPSADPTVTKEVLNKYLTSDGALSPNQGSKGLRRSTLDPQYHLSLRSPSDPEGRQDSTAPFDLTPKAELDYKDSNNWDSERRLLIQDSSQLRNLWGLMVDPDRGLLFQSIRIRLRTYQKCIAGHKLVDWLLDQDKAANRFQAVAIGQALVDAKYLFTIQDINTPFFKDDFSLYRPNEMVQYDQSDLDLEVHEESTLEDSAPLWFQEIGRSKQQGSQGEGSVGTADQETSDICSTISDLSHDSAGRIKLSERHFDDPLPQSNMLGSVDVADPNFENVMAETEKASRDEASTWRTLDISSDDTVEKEAFDKLQLEHHEHLTTLTKQLLYEEGLPSSWADIIISTVDRVSLFVKPDVRNNQDDMDIRRYVHIKKIPGGKREQTSLVHGVIFKKNVAHKKMAHSINNPSVLLLAGSIEYQRVENKMSSLQPQILQEGEFLHKVIGKIVALKPKPDVLVVEKSVSRLAQDYLLKKGITLVYNVKQSVMERLSRVLVTDIAPSVESLVGGYKLGFCHNFSARSFLLSSGETKTMLYFDGCATHLGCAVTLYGASNSELKKVKRIMKFLIYASYHSRMEISFCMDEFLMPPSKQELDLDTEDQDLFQQQHNKPRKDKTGKTVEAVGKTNNSAQVYAEDKVLLSEPDGLARVGSFAVAVGNEQLEENGIPDEIRNVPAVATSIEPSDKLAEGASNAKAQNDCDMTEETSGPDRMSTFIRVEVSEYTDTSTSDSGSSEKQETDEGKHAIEKDIPTNAAKSEPGDADLVSENSEQTLGKISFELGGDLMGNANTLTKETGTESVVSSGVTGKQSAQSFVENKTESAEEKTSSITSTTVTNKTSEVSAEQPSPGVGDLAVSDVMRRRDRHSSGQRSIDRSPGPQRRSNTIQLTDNSDPLNNYQISQDDSIFQANLRLEEQLLSHRFKFKKALDNVILSAGPYIKFDLPYLETEAGSKCELRKYFSEEIYWSSHFSSKPGQTKAKARLQDQAPVKKYEPPSNVHITEAHDFVRCQMINSANHASTKYMLAKFRAYGGRIHILDYTPQQPKLPKAKSPDAQKAPPTGKDKDKDKSSGELTGKDKLSGEVTEGVGKEAVRVWERKVDCLDPYKHQRIAVLFNSYSYESENHPSPCVYPWVVMMDFYGRNDITLGGFLERFCFRPSYVCPSDSCNTSMVKHIRRFVHGTGSISIVLKKLEHPIPNGQLTVLIWSWCHKCKQVTPVTPMSSDTWHMSFAKYLELRFHGKQFQRRASFEPCLHSLHHDHFQYFGFRDTVASFKYSSIKLKEIKLSPMVIAFQPVVEVIQLYRHKDEVKRLTNKLTELYSLALEYLTKMKAECNCDYLIRSITECLAAQQGEKTQLRELSHSVREKITSMLNPEEDRKIIVLNQDQRQLTNEIEDGILLLKRGIADAVSRWNTKFQDLYIQQRKSRQVSGGKKDKDTVSLAESATPDTDTKMKQSESDTPTISPSDEMFSMSGSEFSCDGRRKSDFTQISLSSPQLRTVPSVVSMDSYVYGVTPGISAAHLGGASSSLLIRTPSDGYVVYQMNEAPSAEDLEKYNQNSQDTFTPPPSVSSAVGSLQALDEGREEEDGASEPEKTTSTDTLVAKVSSAVESLQALDEGREEEDRASEPEKTTSTDTLVAKVELPVPELEPMEAGGEKIGTSIRKTIMNTIWQGSGAYQLQMPFEQFEHYLLPPCDRLPVVVYDCEQSSIIAYSLSCHDYGVQLQQIQASYSHGQRSKSDAEMGEDAASLAKRPSSSKLSFFKGNGKETAEVPDSVRYIPRSDNGLLESPEADMVDYTLYTASTAEVTDKTSKSSKPPPSPHIELQFSDSTARFYCKVYFAEQFRHLRRHIFPEGEDVFIRSLSRCKPWEAKGGKSGSSFCKTDDDRFILKQMSFMEVESFEKFGPQYFQYITKAERHQRPLALAKIVGVYRIGFRNQTTNNAMKQDLLVMENLFYNRTISQTFDLKGSERNRLVKTNRKRDEELVLMDENFLRASVDCPLYILPHSKTMLERAINHDTQFLATNLVMDYSLLVGLDEQNKELVVGIIAINHDTQFLATNLVMDYSLLVGLDEQNKELVVGIIDYIRTFTWDKKLETIIKSNFGGQGKMPTVVSPEVYRNRFMDAMGKYFLQVPDQWTGLGHNVETT